jgi:uncharacterized protein (TIGR03437 family)
VFLAALPLAAQTTAPGPYVRFNTNIGNIDVVLSPDAAPGTVANFLNYVNKGSYNNSIIHRSVGGFVIQGGGYTLNGVTPTLFPTDPAIQNEFKLSNVAGTIAMAKGNDPNSATSQWFFNAVNNNGTGVNNLDTLNGGFTVFGHVLNAAGTNLVQKINGFPTQDLSSLTGDGGLTTVPLNNYKGGTLQVGNYVIVNSIMPFPYATSAGVVSATSYASSASNGIAPDEFLTIFGSNLGPTNVTSFTLNSNGNLNNTLAGTQVLFDGLPAPIVFTSAGQIGVIAPNKLANQTSTNVVLSYNGMQAAAITFKVVSTDPGLFTIPGTTDAAIARIDGAVIGASNPAAVGDTLLAFGSGVGVTTPLLADGGVVGSDLPPFVNPVTLLIDGQTVPTIYAGPGLINGVVQINFKVPQLAPGSHQIQIQAGGRTSVTGVTLRTK